MINNNIISFLTNRAWIIEKEENKFVGLKPPIEFHLSDDYLLYIPKTLEKADSNVYINNILNIIGDFYSLSNEELCVILQKENDILKVRIHDAQTREGKIQLNRFEELINSIRKILCDTANFVIHKDVFGDIDTDEASRYLNYCNFMQTEKGSFIANIQLPTKETIKEDTLFEKKINSQEINYKLFEVLSFVNQEIIEKEKEFTEDDLIENHNNINVRLYKDIEALLEKTNIENIDFTFHSLESSNSVFSRGITKNKVFRLNQFIEKVQSHIIEEGIFTIKGQITSLSSKDPDGFKNKVTYLGLLENNPVKVYASLNSENYKRAIEAHKLKEYISIKGLAKKTKNTVKFIEVITFSIEDHFLL